MVLFNFIQLELFLLIMKNNMYLVKMFDSRTSKKGHFKVFVDVIVLIVKL